MGKLIRFEMRKLFRKKSLYICMAIAFALVAMNVFAVSVLNNSTMQELEGMAALIYGTTDMSGIWRYLIAGSLSNGSADILLSVLVSLIVCESFRSGAAKTMIARGYSRKKIYFAQYLTAVLTTVLMAMVCWAGSLAVGAIALKANLIMDSKLIMCMAAQLVLVLVVTSIAFVSSMLSEKTAVGIVCGIMIPAAVSLLLTGIDHLLAESQINLSQSQYWISDMMVRVANTDVEQHVLNQSFLLGGAYSLILFFAGFWAFSRKDV